MNSVTKIFRDRWCSCGLPGGEMIYLKRIVEKGPWYITEVTLEAAKLPLLDAGFQMVSAELDVSKFRDTKFETPDTAIEFMKTELAKGPVFRPSGR
jgi:hypothetical protein